MFKLYVDGQRASWLAYLQLAVEHFLHRPAPTTIVERDVAH